MKIWTKSLLMFGGIIGLTIGAGLLYTVTILNTTTQVFKSTYAEAGNVKTEKIIKETEPITILLMGVDTGGEGRGTSDSWQGNSDSQILMTLNPKTRTTTMVSLERDTMTNILDTQGEVVSQEKMNAAYPQGYNAGGLNSAVGYSMKTIGDQTGVDIDSFVTINFDGLINIVDAIGGIDVYNDPKSIAESTAEYPNPNKEIFISDTEPEYTAVIPAGQQHLNGEQALVYSRDRHHRVGGDYGRQIAQRQIISAIFKKILALDNITQYQKILTEISKDFKTNIPINSSTITSFLGYKDCFNKIVSIQTRGVGSMVNGGSYEFFTNDTYLALQNAMRNSLGLSEISTLSSTLVTYENYFGTSSSYYYLPSAGVTENGKTETFGIKTDGSFEKITSSNETQYISGATGSGSTSSSSQEESEQGENSGY